MNKNIVDGATLLGVGLACFALKDSLQVGDWKYWIMVVAALVFMGLSIATVFDKDYK